MTDVIETRLTLRNRIVGLLLRSARERANKTKQECAEALGVSTSTITAYEAGRKPISLPEVEVLAYLTDTPASYFWAYDSDVESEETLVQLEEVLALRHRIVGALLRQARLEADMTQRELAELLDCSPSRISSYEYGEQPISLAELEILAQQLNLSMEYFLDGQEGPVGEWNRQQVVRRRFDELPKEVQEFVVRPINIRYLEVAMKLASMPVGGLRGIAEGLLDITY